MKDSIENGTTTIELEEVSDNVEQLSIEEADAKEEMEIVDIDVVKQDDSGMEIVDIDIVKPSEVDLKLEDEPFEIGMDTVRKLNEDQSANNPQEQSGTDAAKETSSSPHKDTMLTDPEEIVDSLKASTSKKVIVITALISLIGSFFVFCKIHVGDIPAQSIGIFFNGFSGSLISGIISKISIIAMLASAVCAVLNLRKISIWTALISVLTFIAQCAFFVLWGSAYYDIPMTAFRPGIGLFITFVPMVIMLFAVIGNKPKAKS